MDEENFKMAYRIETTFPNKISAIKFAEELLSSKLVGCVQMTEVESRYWWNDEITTDHEILLIIKLKHDNLNEVLAKFKNHPYKIPEISVCEVRTSRDYGEWLEKL